MQPLRSLLAPPPKPPAPDPTPTPQPLQQPAQTPQMPAFQLPTFDQLKFGAEQVGQGIQQAGQQVQEKASQFKMPDWNAFKLGGDEPTATGAAPSAPDVTAGAGSSSPSAPAVGPSPSGPVDTSSPEGFTQTLLPYAERASQRTGVPASAIVAIAANESGWGKYPAGGVQGNNNWFGVKGKDSGTWSTFDTPQDGVDWVADMLASTPRYAKAIEAGRGGNDQGFIQELANAGYIQPDEAGAWVSQVGSIAKQVSSQRGATASPAQALTASSPAVDQAALDDPDKWALCGPVAAVLAAAAHGKDWTVAQAKSIGSSLGLWDAGAGMHGLDSEVALLRQAGVSATTGAADEQRLAQEAANGNTPILSTNGHYFVLQGYDPSTGKFDTGTTGSIFRRGGRYLTLAEMADLGDGIQGAAYMDNPASPTPSTMASPAWADKRAGLPDVQASLQSDTSEPQLSPLDNPDLGTAVGDQGSGPQLSPLQNPDLGTAVGDQGQGFNPDQPTGLSAPPVASATPTFPPPLYQDQPQSDVYTPRASDAALQDTSQQQNPIGDFLRPGTGMLPQAIRAFTGADQAEADQHRWIELNKFASDNGYVLGASDPKFRRDYPELAKESDDLTFGLVAGMATPDLEGGQALLGGARPHYGEHLTGAPALERAAEEGQSGRGASTWATSISDPNMRYDFHYEVRPLYDLTTSHTDAITPHPDFPSELQPRLRDRAASRDQINRIAGQLAPDELLAETHRIDSGPPIIGPDGVVESGNGRTMALRLAQQRYPERFAAYQDALREHATAAGIDPATIDATPNPVLVRVRDSAVDRPKFAAEANQGAVMQMAPYEQALQDARRITPETISQLQVSESQSLDQALLAAGNRDVLRAIVATIPANERAGLMTDTGALNTAGLERIKRAIFATAYPGEAGQRLTETFTESLDSGIKNVENGLGASLPAMARAEGLIRTGQRTADLSLSDDLAAAVNVLARLKQEGIPVQTYLGQASMFERELTPLQEQLLGHLDSLSRSPRRIRDFIQGYGNAVESEAHPDQTGMFGEVPRATKAELIDRASGGATDAATAAEQPPQPGLLDFNRPVEPGPAAPAPEAPAAPQASPRLEEPGPRALPAEASGAGVGPPEPPTAVAAPAPEPSQPRLPAETRAARTERRAESVAVGQEAGAVSAAAQADPYTHAVGTGYTTGASPETQAQLSRATGQREFGTVTREESHAAGTALALDKRSMDALDQRINREGATKQGAAEADALRERAVGAIENVQSLQDDVYRLQRQAEEGGQPDVIDQLTAAEKLLTAARDSAALSLTSGRRYAEAAGRTLAQFQYRISAQAAQKVAARIEQLSTLAKSARLAVDVKPGRKLSPRAIDDLERLGQQLPQDGDLLRNGSAPVQAVGEKIKQAARENGRALPEDKPLAEQLGALEREHAAAHGDQARQTEIGTRREALLEQIRTEAEARAQEIADARGKTPKELSAEEIERAINQAVGGPTVTTINNEALAAERARRGPDAVQDPIRAAVDQFRTGERTAVTDDRAIAKHWLEQAVQFPDDMGIRQAAHDAIDTIATHGLKGQRLAETVRKSLEIRLGKSYDNLMAGVKRRNDAATLAQIKAEDRANAQLMAGVERRNQEQVIHYAAQFDRLHIQELSGDIRDFVAAARTNPDILSIRDAFGESRLQRLQGDLALVNQAGAEKASQIRQQMFKAGILHLAQKSAKDMAPDEMDGLVKALGNVKTPEDLATLVRAIRQPRLIDYLYEVQYVNMLSSPVTHLTNAAANVAQLAGRLAFNPLTVAGDVLLNQGNRATTGAEVGAAYRGAARGLGEGLRGAAEVMKTGQRPGASQQAIELGNLSGMNREFLTERFGPLGAALHMVSSRPLEAMDVLLGHMAYASAVEQGATREAAKLIRAGDAAVKGMSLQKAAGVVLGNIWDHPGVLEEAGKVRDYTLLRGSGSNPLERWLRQGAALRNAPADAGFARQALAFVGNQALPFFGVPLNYAKQGLERSVGAPVNTVRMLTEKDPALRAELFKKAVVGYGIMGTALVLAAGDNLTGDGPKDPAQRDLWLADHQPNSVRLPGTKDWHSWQSTPWGMPFAIVANTKEAVDEAQAQAGKKALAPFEAGSAVVQGGLRGAASGIMNQTFLQNLGQMYGQFTGTQDAFPPLVAGTASRFIQPAMVRWLARITDGMERDATHGQTTGEQIGQRLASGYPGARETLPERQNVLGQAEPNQSAGPKGILPLAFQGRTGVAPGNVTVQAFQGEGISIPRPASDIALGQGVKVPLSPAEQRQWSAARGPVLQDLTQKALANPRWATFTSEQRTAVLKDILNSAHDVANSQIIKAIGGADEVRRRLEKAS